MLAAPPLSLEWITGQMRMIEATFFVPDMDDMQRRAWIKTYRDALADIPAPFAAEAFAHMSRTLTRKPSPADIRNRAVSQRQQARERLHLDRTEHAPLPAREPSPDISPEERERIIERTKALSKKLRWRKNPGRSEKPEVPVEPRRRSDAEIQQIIDANPARRGMTVERFREVEG